MIFRVTGHPMAVVGEVLGFGSELGRGTNINS